MLCYLMELFVIDRVAETKEYGDVKQQGWPVGIVLVWRIAGVRI